MAVSYYVYYRVAPDSHAAARKAVAAIFRELRATLNIAGRLACRRDDPDTWMEIYEGVGDAQMFEETLKHAAQVSAIGACLQPGAARMLEIFLPMKVADSAAGSKVADV